MKLRAEAIGDSRLGLVSETQPLISGASISSLAQAYHFKRGYDAIEIASQANAGRPVIPVTFEGSSCRWRPVAAIDPVSHSDVMLMEISNPMVNPFARGESGVFARLSVGGRDAQWYWVPTSWREGRWRVGRVVAIELHED